MDKKVLAVLLVLVILLGAAYVKRRGIMRVLKVGPYQTTMTQPTQPAMTSPTTAANGVFMTKSDPKLGSYFSDPKGMTLYTYAKDTAGISNCSGQCLTNWPPYLQTTPMPTLPAGWGTMKRTDGSVQYTYKNMPLYYYVGDKAVGDTNGQGVGGAWWVAK